MRLIFYNYSRYATEFEVEIKKTIKLNLEDKLWINNITIGEYQND
ncbi:hypothetical protein [Clostridium estertheticum]|nr:hypothetical protein [Clostridium estertheticum]